MTTLKQVLAKVLEEGGSIRKAINKRGEQFGVNVKVTPSVASLIGRTVEHNGVSYYVNNINTQYQEILIARRQSETVESATAGL